MNWLRGKWLSVLGFLGVAILILGGLGWTTRAALKVEEERQLAAQNATLTERQFQLQNERAELMRLALWRLESRLSPALAREESRPYPQYLAIHSPFPALAGNGFACAPGQVYLPSPLLTAELPDWMTLHFHIEAAHGWTSPQVITDDLQKLLRKQPIELALNNVTTKRAELLEQLSTTYPAKKIATAFREMGVMPSPNRQFDQRLIDMNDLVNTAKQLRAQGNGYPEGRGYENSSPNGAQQAVNPGNKEQLDYANRMTVNVKARREGQWTYIYDDNRANVRLSGGFPSMSGVAFQTVDVQLGAMQPVWLPSADNPKHLLMVRGVAAGGKPAYQGFLVDWPKLQEMLRDEVSDLFPDAKFLALPPGEPPHPERALTTMPIQFEPEIAVEEPVVAEAQPMGWTPLRIGLTFAWSAALVALLAVGLGGLSILSLSDRRIRFVSAVTHELRTPMTTLRLYLDLLSSGMIKEEAQKTEYLKTLNTEADRLYRLIGNVLDFARLEKSRPTIDKRPILIRDFVSQIERMWSERCLAASKSLVVENPCSIEETFTSDPNLVEQIISNLIDNAQKYSRDACDDRIVLRICRCERGLAIEVEDRGPGVARRESGSIFRAFRRGHDADVKAGGVGLGLALATRWAHLLGGKLSVQSGQGGIGACFRLDLPGTK